MNASVYHRLGPIFVVDSTRVQFAMGGYLTRGSLGSTTVKLETDNPRTALLLLNRLVLTNALVFTDQVQRS